MRQNEGHSESWKGKHRQVYETIKIRYDKVAVDIGHNYNKI